MRRAVCLSLSMLLVTVVGRVAAAQTAAPPFTVDELLKLERESDPQLSSDGSRIAYVVTDVNQDANTRNSDIWVVPVRGGEPVQVTDSPKSDDTPRWSPDGRQLAFVSSRDGSSQVWIVPVDESGKPGTPHKLTALATEASGVKWAPDGKSVLFVSDVYPACDSIECNARTLEEREKSKVKARVLEHLLFRHWTSWKEGRYSHLFLAPADGSGPPRDLTPGAADVPPFLLGGPDDYAFAPDAREIAFAKKTDPVEATSTNSDLFVLDLTDPNARPRKITDNPAADGGPLYSPDGRYIAYRAQSRAGFESDRWQLMLYDRKTGERRSVTPSFDTWVDSYIWSPDSRTIYLTAEQQACSLLFRLDLAGGAPRAITAGGAVSDVSITPDGRTLVFSRSALNQPPELYRAAADGSAMAAITHVTDQMMARLRLRPAEAVWYQGAGGARIHAWVIKPAGFREGQKYPLLVLVHGGPQGSWADAWGYRWNPQVFAAAGYVVFMPNPHGSTGFGQALTDEVSGDWGGMFYEDVMKGTDYAEALPYVEKGRTGAAGASAGGYMMDWLLGHTDRFKAIVTHAGVYNLTSMYGVTEELWFPEWDLKGTPWTNPEMYAKFSPHLYAKNFKTPTLVSHGELDFRVPIGEGLQLFTALQRLGVPSKMLYFPDEGHWINKPANSALWYKTAIEWLDRWVKAVGP